MQNKLHNPFRFEERRSFYARKGYVKKFRELYSKNYPSISNKNTGILWDVLNFSRSGELQNSPVYIDKLLQISKLLENRSGNLLDVGFGKGVMEKKLSSKNFKLFGIDISKKSVDELSRSVKGIFKKGDILKIPFRSNYFDCVLCLDVLEHISTYNTFKALKEINRVLKHDSYLIISIPLNEGLEEMVEKNINPNAHVRVYTPDILKMELKISGFDTEREIYLSAFDKNYFFKKLVNQIFRLRKPNLLIILAKKK